jgi:hypothetical protein
VLKHPDNEDALIAFSDLEFWNDHALQAMVYCERGLNFHPGSKSVFTAFLYLQNPGGSFPPSYFSFLTDRYCP